MLLKLHTRVNFGMEDKVVEYEDQFISSCMRIIREQKELIEARTPEQVKQIKDILKGVYGSYVNTQKLNESMPDEEKRIIQILSYLKQLVLNSERDGMNGVVPHEALE